MSERQPVLVVEDNEDDAFFMRRALRGAGGDIDARFVTNGPAALDYLRGVGAFADRSAHPMPTATFLDLKMPLMHGLDVLATIRRDPALKHLRVFVLTSSDEERERERARELGVADCLVKPPTREMLHAALADPRPAAI